MSRAKPPLELGLSISRHSQFNCSNISRQFTCSNISRQFTCSNISKQSRCSNQQGVASGGETKVIQPDHISPQSGSHCIQPHCGSHSADPNHRPFKSSRESKQTSVCELPTPLGCKYFCATWLIYRVFLAVQTRVWDSSIPTPVTHWVQDILLFDIEEPS